MFIILYSRRWLLLIVMFFFLIVALSVVFPFFPLVLLGRTPCFFSGKYFAITTHFTYLFFFDSLIPVTLFSFLDTAPLVKPSTWLPSRRPSPLAGACPILARPIRCGSSQDEALNLVAASTLCPHVLSRRDSFEYI